MIPGVTLQLVKTSSTFATPQIRYLTILPFIILLGGAVIMLGISALIRRPMTPGRSTLATEVISLTALGFALWQWFDVSDHGPTTSIVKAVVMDGFSSFFAILVCCALVLAALVSKGFLDREEMHGPEFYVLALVSASGAILMAEANDLIVIFLGLEIMSIALYVLAAMNSRRAASGEAALKYFILGAFSSAIFVYGIALTYGATGSTNLGQIADFLSRNVVVDDGVLLAGLGLLLVGFLFKVAAVPFHMWTPDVYDGAPSPVTGFMAAVAKAGGFAALLRVFISSFGVLGNDWRPIIYVIAIASIALGAMLAIVQRDVKRMLAYSSINHAGFILLGLQAATATGVKASLYYLFTYMIIVIGSFGVVTVLGRHGDASHDIASYRGLAKRQPMLALAFAILLLAQAGAPFTTGFWAKLLVVQAAVNAGSVPLAVVAMAGAAIATFFYLRVAVLMYSGTRAGIGGLQSIPGEDAGEDPGLETLHVAPGRGGYLKGPLGALSATTKNATLLLETEEPTVANLSVVAADAAAPSVLVSTATVPMLEQAETQSEPEAVRVDATTAFAIFICVGATVFFGCFPGWVLNFAQHATLLFGH